MTQGIEAHSHDNIYVREAKRAGTCDESLVKTNKQNMRGLSGLFSFLKF